MKRDLKIWLVFMIAIGSTIGRRLFLESGSIISKSGPGESLISYGFIVIVIYFTLTSLCEMATYMPTSGSFIVYSAQFCDPALVFAFGRNYWYNWTVTVAVDINLIGIIIQF
jgi:amino acid permease